MGGVAVGAYAESADLYDLLYAGEKDFRAEAELLAGLIREVDPGAERVLDVGCGTGEHARWLTALGFRVDGVDIEPAFVEIARGKCPGATFVRADMTTLDLGRTYDVVTCLFSAIGYVVTVDRLKRTVARLARHLEPGGVVIIDPWFEPEDLTDRWVAMLTGEAEGIKACRISRTRVEGRVSRLEFEYLVGRPEGIRHWTELHELGLFSQAEMEDAFRGAGLGVRRIPEALRTRGIYIGQRKGG